ncbi:myotrophin-like [Pecten maximus]|uniref:myotrophin-like n=1 Tax=Pecten maximus TaxID=6579 RepID=UPI001458E312|nr:myotrophin-like [Pecten maximus]
MSELRDLQWVVQNGDISSVKAHLEKGVNVNEVVKKRTLLHMAADYGQIEVLKLLLKSGAEVNATDSYDMTPLLAAIFENHLECVKVLINSGASLEGTTPDGQSYYDVASEEMKKVLIEGRTAQEKR